MGSRYEGTGMKKLQEILYESKLQPRAKIETRRSPTEQGTRVSRPNECCHSLLRKPQVTMRSRECSFFAFRIA